MKIIHIPIEVKSRELIPKLFFISRALKKNFACFIGDKVAVNRSIRFFKSGIYFHKSINKNDKDYIKKIRSRVNAYISLDEEAGSAITNAKEFNNLLNYRSSYENVKNVDKIYNWGNFDCQVWKKKYQLYKSKFKIVGHPKFDLLKKKIINLIFKKEINVLKKRYKDFIFIPSTFISSKKRLEKVINFEKQRINNSNYLKKRVNDRIFNYKLFLSFKKLISVLSKDFPNLKIVIKPHPTENRNDWEKEIKKYSNVHIDDEYNLLPYLYTAKLVIFNSSTAGIESVLLNKKTLCFKELSDKYSTRSYYNNFGIKCKSYKVLKKHIISNFVVNNSKNLNLLKKRIMIKKKFSSDLILEDLKKNFKSLKNFKLSNIFSFYFFSLIYNIKDLIYRKLKLNSNKKNFDQNFPIRTMSEKLRGGIKKKEISLIMLNLGINQVKIKNFGRNGYLLFK